MRFYFDVHDDVYSAEDEDGMEIPSVSEARKKASDIATSIARDLFDANGSKVLVTVRDETKPLFALTVTLAVEEFERANPGIFDGVARWLRRRFLHCSGRERNQRSDHR